MCFVDSAFGTLRPSGGVGSVVIIPGEPLSRECAISRDGYVLMYRARRISRIPRPTAYAETNDLSNAMDVVFRPPPDGATGVTVRHFYDSQFGSVWCGSVVFAF